MTRYWIILWSTSKLNELSLSLPSLCTMHSVLHNLLLNLKTSKWMIMHWVRLYLLYELGLISKSNAWDAYSQLWTLLTSLKAFAIRMMVSKWPPHFSTQARWPSLFLKSVGYDKAHKIFLLVQYLGFLLHLRDTSWAFWSSNISTEIELVSVLL